MSTGFSEMERLSHRRSDSCLPRFHLEFHLATDACDTGLGAVLSQEYCGREHEIACSSRTKAEWFYSTTEKEALALVWDTSQFLLYLYGHRFTLVTGYSILSAEVAQIG